MQTYSFGYSATPQIQLSFADAASTDSNFRLSWHLDIVGKGGWRAGSAVNLNTNIQYQKMIFVLKNPLMSPTEAPTVFLPSCNVAYREYVGDGYCDGNPLDNYNSLSCMFDRGDCCPGTCISKKYQCGINGYNCINPSGSGSPSLIPTIAPSAPSNTPSAIPTLTPSSSSPTQVPSSAIPTISQSPTQEPTSRAPKLSPTTPPTERAKSAPTTKPSTRIPSHIPTKATKSPIVAPPTASSQTIFIKSSNLYRPGTDHYLTVRFANLTTLDSPDQFFCTVIFGSDTNLRSSQDYITLFKSSETTEHYGNAQYTGTAFPGVNGIPALGFNAPGFVLYFHTSSQLIPTGKTFGYSLEVTITRFSNPNEIPLANSAHTEQVTLNSAMFGILASALLLAVCFACCTCFWNYRARKLSAKLHPNPAKFSNITKKVVFRILIRIRKSIIVWCFHRQNHPELQLINICKKVQIQLKMEKVLATFHLTMKSSLGLFPHSLCVP